ncbi:GntR family transcriptional regulator [Methylomonas sp. AM2-LC]|uniref:GntR family transcriptional regulator n=1 Tax=Methylomonas sp. AM2-LC TaxID=3153301 RepID=UPI003265AB28
MLKTPSHENVFQQLRLDHHSSQPYYQQLQQQLLGLIESGALAPGQNLPAERALADLLQISRTTVKRCYDQMREADTLVTLGRGGTVVQAPKGISPEMGRLKGFTEEMQELGMSPSTKLLERKIVQDRTLASMFGRPAVAKFLKLVRLRLADEQSMSREVAWYDLTLAPSLADWDAMGSSYAYLQENCQIRFANSEQSIEAVLSSEEESQVFGFTQPSPCLLIKRRIYSDRQQLVEYVEGTFRGDAYAYRIKLQV